MGQQFDFDVIAKEPLKDNLLAGAAFVETAEASRYLKPSDFELELLTAGGLFKRMKAGDKPESNWVSAILIRGDGITLITQRIRVEK